MLRYDPILLRYVAGDTPLDLTLTELQILNLLRFCAGRVVQTRDIDTLVFGGGVASNTVYVHVGRVRRKLNAAAPGLGDRIVSVRYEGYAWRDEQ